MKVVAIKFYAICNFNTNAQLKIIIYRFQRKKKFQRRENASILTFYTANMTMSSISRL